jgi:hypothetical protein
VDASDVDSTSFSLRAKTLLLVRGVVWKLGKAATWDLSVNATDSLDHLHHPLDATAIDR